jgi:Tfp pilus assembly protein PilF
MEQEAWSDAEVCFREVIARGDVLPQPWGNIGICLLMQQRYDEAEQALKRALEIDPDYKLARANLANVERARSGEIIPRVAMSDPFANTKRSVDFFRE